MDVRVPHGLHAGDAAIHADVKAVRRLLRLVLEPQPRGAGGVKVEAPVTISSGNTEVLSEFA